MHVDKKKRGRTARSLWKWMKRRAAVEPGIGHLKSEHRMDRNRLHGEQGDMLNALMSAAGMNFRKLLKHAGAKAALTRNRRKAALKRKRRAAGKKAWETMQRKRKEGSL